MTVTTTLAALKSLVSGLSPSSGAAANVYAIPADVTANSKTGGLSFSSYPVGLIAQRLGNDQAQNTTGLIASGCEVHEYHAEIMIALVDAETVNKKITGGWSTPVVFAPYEAKAQEWRAAIHTALVADLTLSGTVRIGNNDGRVIEDYRVGYLPWDMPQLHGLWCSVRVLEDL